MPCIWLMRMR
jgi:hypothetical protein